MVYRIKGINIIQDAPKVSASVDDADHCHIHSFLVYGVKYHEIVHSNFAHSHAFPWFPIHLFISAGHEIQRTDFFMIQIATDVMPETINSGAYLASLAIVQICCETMLGKLPTTAMDGNALAATGSEAGVVLARSTLILAIVHEEKLVSEQEELYAADFERELSM